MHVPPLAFFITKYFGSGVIIATAFIHVRMLTSRPMRQICIHVLTDLATGAGHGSSEFTMSDGRHHGLQLGGRDLLDDGLYHVLYRTPRRPLRGLWG